MQKDIGVSSEQVKQNVILFKGDYLTIRNTRLTRQYACMHANFQESKTASIILQSELHTELY
jgi:hypothetical protein